MRQLIILTAICFFTACKGRAEKNAVLPDSTNMEPLLIDSSQIKLSIRGDTTIIRDNFLNELLTFPDLGKDIDKVSLLDFEIVKIPKTNTHDPQVIDTIYHYKGNAGEFRVYKASDKYILYNFHIYGSSFRFKNGIKTGMSKSKLLETLNINASFTDTLIVEDTEGFSTVGFVFKNEKLIDVKYEGYLD